MTRAENNVRLTVSLILKVHDWLLRGIVTPKLRGRLRQAQNVIKDHRTGRIVYLPPAPSDVAALLKALVYWVNRALMNKTSPLLVAPIFHYRFVTIHPFMDGNGRAARLLTNFILCSHHYTVQRFAALEKQHEINRIAYYQHLRKLQADNFYDIPTDIDVSGWIAYWLGCLEKTYSEAISRLKGQKRETSPIPKLDRRLQKAVGLFKQYEKLTAFDYQALTGLGRTQAVADLNRLQEHKIIKRSGGGRSTLYLYLK
jgi:Fic family protein